MNPPSFYTLTKEQIERYLRQPDIFFSFKRTLEQDQELPQYPKGSSLRLWYNIQKVGFDTHWHNAVEMIVPLEEDYLVTVRAREYHLKPGDILVIPPGDLHSILAPACGSRLIAIYELDFFSSLHGFSFILSLLSQPLYITAACCPEIYKKEINQIMLLAEHYWSGSPVRELLIYSCLLNFFAVYWDYFINQDNGDIPLSPSKKKSLANKLNIVFDYLEHHYTENISLEDAAAAAGFSKFYFSKLFKQCTGQTFYDYLSSRRIRTAEQLLIMHNLPITDIALQSGFCSISSFNRTFKHLKRCTPSEYRKLYLNDDHR